MASLNFSTKPKALAYDVAIIGGAASGSAIAWYLSANPDFNGSILVIERDPSLARSATRASNNCMRQQFATPVNVKIAQYAAEFAKSFRQSLGGDDSYQDIPIRNFGYLYLSDSDPFTQVLRNDQQLQSSLGAGTKILSADEISSKYPFFRVDDINAGSLNLIDEGAFDAFGMVESLRRKACENGVDYIANEVIGIARSGNKIESITLGTGQIVQVSTLVNAAGTRAASLSRLASLDLPVEARRRYTYIFEVDEPLPQDLPLTIDPSGIHMRSFGAQNYLVDCPPLGPDHAVSPNDFNYEEGIWEKKILPVLQRRIPQFATARVTESWVGHYEFNTFDRNAILGPHTEVRNFFFCAGFSGHGSQQVPACGRAVSELITHGVFKTLDLSSLLYERIAKGEPLFERAVI